MVQVTETRTVDWADWLSRWDAQQALHMDGREERFEAQLQAVDATVGGEIVALDIACGPGAISQRLLTRFPKAQAFAVDLDPLLLEIGRGALGTFDGRLTWVHDDLNDPAWAERLSTQLAGRKLDAVLSSTALHWVSPGTLARVYRELGQLVRPGGVFLNADHLAFAPDRPTIREMAMGLRQRRRESTPAGAEDWERWWQAIEADPALTALYQERQRLFGWRDRVWANAGLAFQIGALKDAGFREVDTIWQKLDNRVLMAVR
ncbi:MAG: class I SAM-dependent methyltransferase [Chloroflexi bacterium]|nr:class I SAM-dependent methyltransferase [Chloroflexota bacterium]